MEPKRKHGILSYIKYSWMTSYLRVYRRSWWNEVMASWKLSLPVSVVYSSCLYCSRWLRFCDFFSLFIRMYCSLSLLIAILWIFGVVWVSSICVILHRFISEIKTTENQSAGTTVHTYGGAYSVRARRSVALSASETAFSAQISKMLCRFLQWITAPILSISACNFAPTSIDQWLRLPRENHRVVPIVQRSNKTR